MSVAKLLEQRSHLIPGKKKVSELFFEVPKDYSRPENGTLRLFARSLERVEKQADPIKDEIKHQPWCLYLEGGPGFSCQLPQEYGFAKFILEKGYKMLFLDQRGTGIGSTITAKTLAKLGGPKEQAAYLKLFRADNIVRDCEAVRKVLTEQHPENKKKWTLLGTSFGGFCITNYLSRFPEGIQEAFMTGGLPPMVKQPDSVYAKLIKRIIGRTGVYYSKFPEDIQRVHNIAHHLTTQDIRTPMGNTLSLGRFRQLGIFFGFHGTMDVIHALILRMATDLEIFQELTRPTLNEFEKFMSFNASVIYAILHEPIYLQGEAANWSAERMLSKHPEFKYNGPSKEPIIFTSEMCTKQVFTDCDDLRPLLETAELLAQDSDWPTLYDESQLAKNEVPVYAVTYMEDLYVDFDFAQETARKIKGCRQMITNLLYHDAATAKSEEVMKGLFALRDDVID